MLSFDPKAYAAGYNIGFNFLSLLPVGVTVSSAAITCAVETGTDASPSSLVSAAVIASPVVNVPLVANAGVVGVIYRITVLATGSDGKKYSLEGLVAVV